MSAGDTVLVNAIRIQQTKKYGKNDEFSNSKFT